MSLEDIHTDQHLLLRDEFMWGLRIPTMLGAISRLSNAELGEVASAVILCLNLDSYLLPKISYDL